MSNVQSDKKEEIRKLVTIGDAQVGKSSLIYRVTHNQTPNITSATIGAAFSCANTKDGKFRLNMWDTAGQERFRSMIPMYLRDIHMIIFVYDVTDIRSFEHLRDYWIDFAFKNARVPKRAMPTIGTHNKMDSVLFDETFEQQKPFCILVANKSDLNSFKKVSTEAGIELAKSIDCPFIELSALTGRNVDQFMSLISNFLNGTIELDDTSEKKTIILDNNGLFGKATNMVRGCNC